MKQEIDWVALLLYGLSAVVGGAGGCAMAAALRAKGYHIDRWVLLSYVSVGAFSSFFFVALFVLKGWIVLTFENVAVYGGMSCLFVVGTISGINFTLHFSARKLGKDLTQVAGVSIDTEDKKDG